ncbi:hypothetical protein FRC06_008684 [Ceratobasidium sp. 370]|nr:hypothetical protein FRC06_008684 [Ceratobasidium sp. 370]
MEEKFKIQPGNKQIIYQLMDKDLYLYPSVERASNRSDCPNYMKPGEYFCVEALGAALEIILFRSSKQVGLVFMEDMCKPDDAERCAHWHRKLRDQTARKGVPPGLLTFAATQMYWALERLYMGTKLNFDEQHYRAVWDRYFRALIKLPHLGRLRVDMLDRLKEYYMVHWPAGELDEDDDSLPAW